MSLLKGIVLVLAVLWLIGLVARVGGAAIHALIVIALVIFVIDMLTGRRTVV